MTVSHIIVILSACDFIDNLKIIEINVEPPVQSIKVRAHLKNGFLLQVTESIGEDFRRYSYHLQDGDVIIIEELKKLVLESKKREFIEETLRKLDVGNEDMRELEKIRGEVWKREKRKHLKK
ncbi:MAG: hypothetical protein LUQ20_06450 [Candidatus Methanoperedens sp.]|nr:hypothetical protein [Candidatus Methanoperedens sp.]